MTDAPALAGASDADRDPAAEVAAAVLAVPGVARLEPSLTTAVRRLSSTTGAGVDGVSVSGRDGRTRVVVDLATDGSRPALGVADEVRRAIASVVTARRSDTGQSVGKITVNVLTIEGAEDAGSAQ